MYRSLHLILVAFLGFLTSDNRGEVRKDDLDAFQGAWLPAFVQNPDSQRTTEEELKSIRLVVKGKEFTLTGKDYTIRGTFTIDPTKSPKTIDVTLANSKNDEGKFLGVYEIEGSIRRSCFAMPRKDRPRTVRPPVAGYLMLEWRSAP